MAVISFKCPNCDGELIFDPATQSYKCEYCASKFSQQELDAMQPAESTERKAEDQNISFEEEKKQQNTAGEEALTYSCPSCGAEIMTDATTAATFCYYCHNPVILGRRLEGAYLPDKVIPFEVTKEVAIQRFLDFVGKKKFVPKAFFNKKQIDCMSGVYFPYWNYDVELDGSVQGSARKVRVWRSGNTEYTETNHYRIERRGDISLTNLTENALSKANVKLAEGVMPYDFSKMKDFNMGYLSGFQAEKRDIELRAVQANMQREMRESAEKMMRETINYSSVSISNQNFVPKMEKWNYCLFPVWTITYKGGDGKMYYFSMNGQTGEVCGELPIDHKKLALVSVGTALLILVVGLIGGFLL